MWKSLTFLAILAIWVSIASSDDSSDTRDPKCVKETEELFVKSTLNFSATLLNDLLLSDPGNNVLCRGASILFLLAEVVLTTTGEAKKQILSLLNFKNTKQMRCYFPKLSEFLNTPYNGIDHYGICKTYADDECRLTNTYKNDIENVFGTRPQNFDFSNPRSAQLINDEIERRSKIANFIKPEMLSSFSGLLLINSASFKAQWEKQFDPKETKLKYFFGSGKKDKKPTMYQRGLFLYADSPQLGAKVIKLKYVGSNFTMAIFLPYSMHGNGYGVAALLETLKNADLVSSVLDNMRLEFVEILLPRFNVTVADTLKTYIEKAGVDKIFDNENSGLGNIASCDVPFVSEILQKLTVQVDESGNGDPRFVDFSETEENMSRPKYQQYQHPYLFKADRPFVYYIFFKKVALFAGAFLH